MQDKDSYIYVGRIKDAHSLKGEVFLKLAAKKADWLENLEYIRLGQPETARNLKVLSKKPHKDGLILGLEGLCDRTAAEALKGQDVSIPESYLVADASEGIYLHQVLGFQVIDSNLGALGSVDSFSSNGAQDLLVVRVHGKEQWIPFVDDFIATIDFSAREIHMNLPAGLIEG